MQRIALVEESATVTAKDVLVGRVRVSTHTEKTEHLVRESLETQDVDVTRVPIGREVIEVPVVRVEGDRTIIPVFEEILVVEKRFVLKEEIHLTRRRRTEAFESTVTLRRQRAVVDQLEPDTARRRETPPNIEEQS